MIRYYSLFSFKTPLLVSFSVEVKTRLWLVVFPQIDFSPFIAAETAMTNKNWWMKGTFLMLLSRQPWKKAFEIGSWTVMNWLPLLLNSLKKIFSRWQHKNDHAWFSFFWEQSRKLMTSFNYVKDDPRNNNLLVSHARIKYSFFKGCYLRSLRESWSNKKK